MKPKSSQKKGKRFEEHVLGRLRATADGAAYRTIGSGNGTEKADIVSRKFGIAIETKNEKRTQLIEWWEQTKAQCFNERPVLAIRNPRKAEFRETLVVLDLEDFVELLAASKGETVVSASLDYAQRSALQRLVASAKDVLGKFDFE